MTQPPFYTNKKDVFEVGDLIYSTNSDEYRCNLRNFFIGMVVDKKKYVEAPHCFVVANLFTKNRTCIPVQPFEQYAANFRRFYANKTYENLTTLYEQSRSHHKYPLLTASNMDNDFHIIPKTAEAYNQVIDYMIKQNPRQSDQFYASIPSFTQLKTNFFPTLFDSTSVFSSPL